MKIKNVFPLKDQPPHVEIGVEVEMEGSRLVVEVDDLGWSPKNDGSLRGESIEYVLSKPLSAVNAMKAVDALYARFNNPANRTKINPSDRCGVHIHLNCQELTILQTFNLASLYLMVEDVLVKWCGEDREGNLFCLRASDAEGFITQLIRDKVTGNFRHSLTDRYRYASLNVGSLARFGTLEFRALRTPSAPERINLWIEMLLGLKEFSMKTPDARDMISGCSAKGAENFLSDIFNDDIVRELRCPDANELIMNGVRRVQALVYTPLTVAAPF